VPQQSDKYTKQITKERIASSLFSVKNAKKKKQEAQKAGQEMHIPFSPG